MSSEANPSTVEALEHRIEQLEARLAELESVEAIKKVQRVYGYYVDYKLWDEAVALFADHEPVVEISANGVYRGKERVHEFYRDIMGGGHSGRPTGQLNNHIQLQGVVNIDPTGDTAHGRWRELTMISAVDPGGNALELWAEGVYENEYIREDGLWKIKTLRWLPSFSGRLQEGVYDTATLLPPMGEPDEPSTFSQAVFRERKLSYHYQHPVTREDVDLRT